MDSHDIRSDGQSPKTEPLAANRSPVYHFIKRTADIVLSVLGLIVCIPIFFVIAIAIRIEDPKAPAFYSHQRIGWNGKVFNCYKLRSMYAGADDLKASLLPQNEVPGPVFKIRNDPRVTRVGRIIRKWSIDELPQLWNVLKGDMSLVGPRPLVVEEELACNSYQRQRELVKPGLTCYWQVSGRHEVPFDEWIEMDLKYIREQSVWTDLKLLLKTVPAVLSCRGAS